VVWLDGGDDGPDKGNTSPDFCRTSTAAEVFENDGECPDSENTGYNKCTCIWKGNYFPTFPDQRDRSVTGRLHLSLSVIPDPEKCKNRIVIYHGPSTKIPLRSLS
jgi:hypothetical protein